jgi:hypothetical protein
MQNNEYENIDILNELNISDDEVKTINIENINNDNIDSIFSESEKIEKYTTIEYIHIVKKQLVNKSNTFIS